MTRPHPGLRPVHFAAVSELHGYPAWFLPSAAACRKAVPQARAIMQEVVSKRQDEARRAEREGKKTPEYNDVIAWAQPATGGNIDMGELQLSLAMAAMFTTTEMFRQILIELACHPEFVEPLRSEVSRELSAHGVSLTALNNMVLLDSFMKESQRQSAGLGMCLCPFHNLSAFWYADFSFVQSSSSVQSSETQSFPPAKRSLPALTSWSTLPNCGTLRSILPHLSSTGTGFFVRGKKATSPASSSSLARTSTFLAEAGTSVPVVFFANNEVKLTLAYPPQI